MIIYSPTYQGKHNYEYYDELKRQLNDIGVLNVDFVHLNELAHYFEVIFCPVYCDYIFGLNLYKEVIIESYDRKRLNIVRKVLRNFIIEYTETWKAQKHYRLKVK